MFSCVVVLDNAAVLSRSVLSHLIAVVGRKSSHNMENAPRRCFNENELLLNSGFLTSTLTWHFFVT